jgi:hypothetical protein
VALLLATPWSFITAPGRTKLAYAESPPSDPPVSAEAPQTEGVGVRYGVALTTAFVIDAGAMCNATTSCILGSGAGFAGHLGIDIGRTGYAGLSYAVTKQDPARIYRLATLQELRLDARRYLDTGRNVRPLGLVALGVLGYGDQFSVDTWGPHASLGGGAEFELTAETSLLVTASYRIARMSPFLDPSQTQREASWVQFLSLEIGLEVHTK